MRQYNLTEGTTSLLNCLDSMRNLYSDVYHALSDIYEASDVDDMINGSFIDEFSALEKRVEAFVMESIKNNMNSRTNDI